MLCYALPTKEKDHCEHQEYSHYFVSSQQMSTPVLTGREELLSGIQVDDDIQDISAG